jgi:hypothetical protein
VALLRDVRTGPEVLLTHRPATMAFAAGMHVFPGGRVDADDASAALFSRSAIGPTTPRTAGRRSSRRTLRMRRTSPPIRELWGRERHPARGLQPRRPARSPQRERHWWTARRVRSAAERLDLRLRTDLLRAAVALGHPAGYPRRFDAQLLRRPASRRRADAHDRQCEVVSLEWFRPSDALDAMAEGASACGSRRARRSSSSNTSRIRRTWRGSRRGRSVTIVVDEPAPDVVRDRHACRRRRRRVSRSVPTSSGKAGSCSWTPAIRPVRRSNVASRSSRRARRDRAIALTHADPDHHGGAEGLAERLGVPVLAGPGAARRLPVLRSSRFGDGDVIHVGDVPLQVVATPGPRPDHLCFLRCHRRRGADGDLDGSRGARMLPGPRTRSAWARSRSRLDALAPNSGSPGIPPDRYSPKMSDDLWPEARGPHLPDTLMRIPLGVWPFLGLAVLAAYGQWEMLRAVRSTTPSMPSGRSSAPSPR